MFFCQINRELTVKFPESQNRVVWCGVLGRNGRQTHKIVLPIESGCGWNGKEAEITVVLTKMTQSLWKDGTSDLFDLALKSRNISMGHTF